MNAKRLYFSSFNIQFDRSILIGERPFFQLQKDVSRAEYGRTKLLEGNRAKVFGAGPVFPLEREGKGGGCFECNLTCTVERG